MTSDGVEAMKITAKAFEKQIHQLRKEAAERRASLARKGSKLKFEVGDEVSLFIPPSEQEAKKAGRKVKYLSFSEDHLSSPKYYQTQRTSSATTAEYTTDVSKN